MEVPAFRSYQPRRSSKMGLKSLASSVETGFQSFGSSLSSLGTNIKGRMRNSQYGSPSNLPEILTTPHSPLPSLSLDPPLMKWESEDLLIKDYIFDVRRMPTQERASIIPSVVFAPAVETASTDEQNPFADAFAIQDTPRSPPDLHDRDIQDLSAYKYLNLRQSDDASVGPRPTKACWPGISTSSMLYGDVPYGLPVDRKLKLPTNVSVPPTGAIGKQLLSWMPADPPPQPIGNGREGRILPALPIRTASARLPVQHAHNKWNVPHFPPAAVPTRPKFAARSPSYPPDDSHDTRLHRNASASTARTALSGASSGSSAASMYLCAMCSIRGGGGARRHGRLGGFGGGRSCGACGAPIVQSDSDGNESVSAESESSLSRFL
ncbi:hypothetical protein HDU86_002653 [Geranomyces michiganensis]|nr:hypothetical protein HDU86_002653 [Geranomyces michiganensis]